MAKQKKPEVAVVMGSDSDWSLLEETVNTLTRFGVGCEVRVMSAHRTPDLAANFARNAGKNGIKVIIAAAGGAAHLAGVVCAHTILPVIGIPVTSSFMNGLDSLLSTVQMPAGVPVGTLAIGEPGAINAGLLAAKILGLSDPALAARVKDFRTAQTDAVTERPVD